jgi:hypothetical protein
MMNRSNQIIHHDLWSASGVAMAASADNTVAIGYNVNYPS